MPLAVTVAIEININSTKKARISSKGQSRQHRGSGNKHLNFQGIFAPGIRRGAFASDKSYVLWPCVVQTQDVQRMENIAFDLLFRQNTIRRFADHLSPGQDSELIGHPHESLPGGNAHFSFFGLRNSSKVDQTYCSCVFTTRSGKSYIITIINTYTECYLCHHYGYERNSHSPTRNESAIDWFTCVNKQEQLWLSCCSRTLTHVQCVFMVIRNELDRPSNRTARDSRIKKEDRIAKVGLVSTA